MRAIFLTLFFGILISIVGYSIYTEIYTEPQLRKKLLIEGRFTIAIIDDVTIARRSSQIIPTYTFKVNNQSITSRKKGIIQKTFHPFSENSVGTKRYVLYLYENPNVNSILPYCIPPDSIEIPINGWEKLPTGTIEFMIP